MAVVYAHDELLEIPTRIIFGQAPLAAHHLEQVSPSSEFHGYCQVVRSEEYLSRGTPTAECAKPVSSSSQMRGKAQGPHLLHLNYVWVQKPPVV
jgi:hypothetical protein